MAPAASVSLRNLRNVDAAAPGTHDVCVTNPLSAAVRRLNSLSFLRFSALFIAVAMLTACGGSGSSPLTKATPAATPAPQTTGAPPASTSPTSNVSIDLPQIKLTRVFPSQGFAHMTGMYELPDFPGRFWVLEQQGRILSIDAADPERTPSVVVDLRTRVTATSSELGLLGLAFAPDFAKSGVFYVDYTAAGPLRTVIARFTSPGMHQTAAANPDVILEVMQPFENHNGGQTTFGPDGFLYISFGDGGSARDPMANGQNRNVLLGKILRIDVSGTSEGRAYKVPADNPFVGQPNTRDEIYAYGLRNPWRFSFDKATGQLWAGDVGQSAREEVDIITKGTNYGWNVMEGTTCLTGGNNCDKSGKTLPIFEYQTTTENCAITGGFVYRGKVIPSLTGAYVYSDYCSGKVWALRYDGAKVTVQSQIAAMGTPLSSFAQDASGELYALSYGDKGGIFKLTP